MRMPTLETARLTIRPFVSGDLADVQRLLDVELAAADTADSGARGLDARRRWLTWTVMGYEELAELRQPPYGDRAVILRASGALIGACGYVPGLAPFGQVPTLRGEAAVAGAAPHTPEFGLYYAISPRHRRQGFATEAAAALVEYAFAHLHLRRVIATTEHDNVGSIGVMGRLGMAIDRNSQPTPPWLQIVGVRRNPAFAAPAPSTYAPDGGHGPKR